MLLLAALAAPLAAQPGAVADQISVELVNVEVHVLDGDGRPVAGLERAAFSLLDDGRPTAITHFAWVPPAGAGGDSAPARAAAEPRRVALFFDDLQAGERSRAPLLAAFYQQLDRYLAPDDLVSVVRFDGANLDVLLDGSDDRRRLVRALEELIGYSPGQVRAALELRHAIGLLRHSIEDDPQTCSQTGQLVRQYSAIVKAQVESSAGGLLRYAQRFGQQPGRRVLLHVSGGIPLIAGDDALAWAGERCDASAIARGIAGPSPRTLDGATESRGYWNPRTSRLAITEFSTAELWRNVAARINTLGITLYPVLFGDAESRFRDEQRGGAMTPAAAFAARANSRDALSFLADATGGLMLDAVADVGGGVERFARDLGGYYSLAFTPSPDGRAGVRPIRIAVARDDVTLRHRESYRLQSRDERISFQLAELLAGERLDDPLGLSLAVVGAGGAASARLRVVVPLAKLATIAALGGGEEGRFTVYVAVRREGGQLLVPRQRSVVVRRADAAVSDYTYDVVLPAAASAIAVAVADDYSGTVGFARRSLAGR